LLIKFVVLFPLARFFGLGLRAAVLTGLLMMPFDEIAYVILASANANGLLRPRDYTVGLTVISLSFVLSPVLINLGYKLAGRLRGRRVGVPHGPKLTEDVVVAGYGYVGRAICALLERARVPYTAFELDTKYLADAEKTKHNVRYGDLTDPELMEAVAISRARLVVVAMSTYGSTRKMIGNLGHFYPHVPVMTAVQYLAQRDELRQMGATHVVALAPEGTLSFGRSVLECVGIPVDQSDAMVNALKSRDYAALRGVGDHDPPTAAKGAQ
jgi:voltage-gated potassium channel Kch